MNTPFPQFQSGQIRFGGYQLLRQMMADAAGAVTWLAQCGKEIFLLHVLPIQRPLSDSEKVPLIDLINHGQRYGHVAHQMILHDVCVEDGQRPVTALVEAFPPLPEGATEWLTLVEWTARQGPATTAQVSPHLPALSRWLREAPAGRHGSLSPEQVWIAGVAGHIDTVAIAKLGLADLQKQLPEMRVTAAVWDDVSGLGHVLFLWLTGKTPTPQSHRDVLADLGNAHCGEKRIPNHWQRLIASNVDADSVYHSSSVTELVTALLQPLQISEAEPKSITTNPTQDRVTKALSVFIVVLLSFMLLYGLNRSQISEPFSESVAKTDPAPQPKAPDLKPRIIPAPEEAETDTAKAPPVLTHAHEKPALIKVPSQPKKEAVAQSNPSPQTVKPKAKPANGTATRSLPDHTKLAVNETKIRIPYRPPLPPSQAEYSPIKRQPLNSEPMPPKVAVAKSSPQPSAIKSTTEQIESKVALSLPAHEKHTLTKPKTSNPHSAPPGQSEPQSDLISPALNVKSVSRTAEKLQSAPEPAMPKAVPIAKAFVVHDSAPVHLNPSPRIVLALPAAEPPVQAVPVHEEQLVPDKIQHAPAISTPNRRDQVRPLILPKGFVPPRGPDKPLWVRP